MNRERLLQLADYLETVADDKFDLTMWSCGTSACAVGHACSNPAFIAEGLSLRIDMDVVYPDDDGRGELRYGTPIFGDREGWFATELFFDIDHETAEDLFSEYSPVYDPEGDRKPPVTRAEVIANIRAYCAT